MIYQKWKIIAIVFRRLLEESEKKCKFVGYKQEYAPITNMNKGTTRNTESDFEHLKDWQDNPNLDDYLSDTHWNQHVNLLIYTYLKARYHGNEVGVYINMALLNGENAFNIDYNQIYGVMFNEAYSFCSYVLNDPVPQTKIAYLEKKAEGLCHIQASAPIISYNILVMVSYILCFANDHNDAVGRFLQSLSFYNNSHVFGDEFHHFENYIKIGLRTVAAIIIDSRLQPPGKLRPGYDYKSKDDYLRKTLPLYREFAEEFEKNIRDAEEKRRSEKITSDGAPKPETTVTPEKKKPDPLSKQLSNEISTYVNNINKCPQTIESLGELVVKAKFKYDFMKAIICGLKSEILMDKAILVIVDAWERYTQKKDDICYETIEHFREYAYDQNGMYEVNRPIRMLKYIDIEKDLEGIKDSELKRRRIDARFKKMILPAAKQEPTEKHGEKPEFNYTEETFKKSAVITDTQLDLVLAELIVMGWMPTTSSQSDFHKLFSGVPGEFLLTWTGKPAQLHDFFDMLTKKKEVKKKKIPGYVTPRGNYLNIVRSHFKDENNNWFGELNHERHIDGTNEILTKLEIVLAYSVDECINMMQTIVREHKNLLENIDLSVKPEHYSNYGRKSKSV